MTTTPTTPTLPEPANRSLYELSGCIADVNTMLIGRNELRSLQALAGEVERLRAEVAALTADAERWKYVRHHWSNAQMHWNNDATNSLKSIVVTIKTAHWTSGADDLDRQIDSARALATQEAK